MKHKPLPNVEVVRSLLDYDSVTGIFTWRTDRGLGLWVKAGDVAGRIMRNGYRQITVDGQQCLAHRLAWLHFHGQEPGEQIDHINGDKADNRIDNLREATFADNMRNFPMTKRNTTGFKGVCFHKRDKRWQASIGFNGQVKHIGSFDSPEEASLAYQKAAREHFGEFYNGS